MLEPPKSFGEVIALWPDGEFAKDIGIAAGLVAVWKHRSTIPPEYWDRAVAGATARRIEGITLGLLQMLYRIKKQGEAA